MPLNSIVIVFGEPITHLYRRRRDRFVAECSLPRYMTNQVGSFSDRHLKRCVHEILDMKLLEET